MTRYNSQTYLDEWCATLNYPRVHDAIFDAFVMNASAGMTLDLCASTGLLGRRVRDVLDEPVWALEGDDDAVDRGFAAGVYDHDYYPVVPLRITPDTLDDFLTLVKSYGTVNVLARRCFTELSEVVPLWALRDGLHQAGVQCIILEGEKQSRRSRHPLGSADSLMYAFESRYHVKSLRGDVRVLWRH